MDVCRDGHWWYRFYWSIIMSNFKEVSPWSTRNRTWLGSEHGLLYSIHIEIPIIHKEIENIIKRLENNKAPGENSIVAELLKKAVQYWHAKSVKLIKTIWKTETVPEEWKTATVCPIFKKRNSIKTENYRGISLLDTRYNMFTSPILERINPYIEKIID